VPFLYIAIGALGVILLIVLLIAVGYWWLKRLSAQLTESAKEYGKGLPAPMRISMEKTDELEWHKPEQVELLCENLRALGYQSVGNFEMIPIRWGEVLRGMEPITRVGGFYHAESGTFASFYDMEALDIILIDLITYFEGDKSATTSTSPDSGMDPTPWSDCKRFPELDPTIAEDMQQLHETMISRIDQTVDKRPAKNFAEIFRKAWAREMDWRMMRGGITPNEVRQIAKFQGNEEPDDETIAALREPWLEQISWFVSDQVKKRYLKKTQMTGDEWAKMEDRLLVVHEMSRREELAIWLTEKFMAVEGVEVNDDNYLEFQNDVLERLDKHGNVPTAFKETQKQLPKSHRYKRLGSFSKPFPGDIWLAPVLEEDKQPDLALDPALDDAFS